MALQQGSHEPASRCPARKHPCVVDETRRPIGSPMSMQVDRRGRHDDDAQFDLEAHKPAHQAGRHW